MAAGATYRFLNELLHLIKLTSPTQDVNDAVLVLLPPTTKVLLNKAGLSVWFGWQLCQWIMQKCAEPLDGQEVRVVSNPQLLLCLKTGMPLPLRQLSGAVLKIMVKNLGKGKSKMPDGFTTYIRKLTSEKPVVAALLENRNAIAIEAAQWRSAQNHVKEFVNTMLDHMPISSSPSSSHSRRKSSEEKKATSALKPSPWPLSGHHNSYPHHHLPLWIPAWMSSNNFPRHPQHPQFLLPINFLPALPGFCQSTFSLWWHHPIGDTFTPTLSENSFLRTFF